MCRFCKVKLRRKNYKAHLKNVHPKENSDDLAGQSQMKITNLFSKQLLNDEASNKAPSRKKNFSHLNSGEEQLLGDSDGAHDGVILDLQDGIEQQGSKDKSSRSQEEDVNELVNRAEKEGLEEKKRFENVAENFEAAVTAAALETQKRTPPS